MWTVEFAAGTARDFELIFDHLYQSFLNFGEDDETAFDRAAIRIRDIHSAGATIARAPFQGTLRDDILPGLRFVRRGKAVFWFIPDDATQVVRILAIFFGGQDHIRHMLTRTLGAGVPKE